MGSVYMPLVPRALEPCIARHLLETGPSSATSAYERMGSSPSGRGGAYSHDGAEIRRSGISYAHLWLAWTARWHVRQDASRGHGSSSWGTSQSPACDMPEESPVKQFLLVASLFALSGCCAFGQLRYRDHPELPKVKVATGEEKGLPEGELGVVTAGVPAETGTGAATTIP